MSLAKNVALVAIGAAGGAFIINQLAKSSETQGITSLMRRQMSDYNATVHPEQERSDTIFDRTQLLNDAKARKPWNMTSSERAATKEHEH